MWQRILVATDGSDQARRAEAAGAEIAVRFGAEVIFVHAVIESPSEAEFDGLAEALQAMGPQQVAPLHAENLAEQVAQATGASQIRTRQDALRAFGQQTLQRAADQARERGVGAVDTRLVEGKPAAAIREAAEQAGVDLIVIGTRGMGGLRGALMGSVAQRVSQDAGPSCLVIKP